MVKKSDLKKLNAIMQEGNDFKNQKNYNKAVEKYLEALSFVQDKVKDPVERLDEESNIRSQIDQIYSVEIIDIIDRAYDLITENQFGDVPKIFDEALRIADKIVDEDMKNYEITEINYLINKTKLEKIIHQATLIKNEERYDEALKILKDNLLTTENLYKDDPNHELIKRFQDAINDIYAIQIKNKLEKANQLKSGENLDGAIEVMEECLPIIDKFYESDIKTAEVSSLKSIINDAYSLKIKPILEKGKRLFEQNIFNEAVNEFENALKIAEKMQDSPQKESQIKDINSVASDALNPIYLEKIKPILDKGKELIIKENYQENVNIVNEALDLFTRALEIANNMADSSDKENKIKEVTDLIYKTCRRRIAFIKDNSMRRLAQRDYEKAVNEIYAAISVAKKLPVSEEENTDIEDLKSHVNKIYITQIDEVIEDGKSELSKGNFDKAIEVFNQALVMTNKMYLNEEMEKEVNKIKELIYQAELKNLVGRGDLSEELQKFERELERLSMKMDYAKTIDDAERRFKEMESVKSAIDEVHHNEIKLLVEHGNQLAGKKKFNESFESFEKAIKINDLIEDPIYKNKIAIKYEYKNRLIDKAGIEIENKNYDDAIEDCNKAIELDSSFVEAYFTIGIANTHKKEYKTAIENFKTALELNVNHAKSWNHLGYAYEQTAEFDNAINAYEKAVSIQSDYAEAYYNMGNSYKFEDKYDRAIEAYKKATSINPNYALAYFFMGTAYFDKKDYNSSVDLINKAIEIKPELGKDLVNLLNDFKTTIESLNSTLSDKFLKK